jgi:small subunit ribosomal protein S17
MNNKSARTIVGKVLSNRMDKTIVVQVERQVKHSRYHKNLRRFSKAQAHDDNNACQKGDLVRIKESVPFSKTKSWELVEIIEKTNEA